jgi:antitoxin (DNA-binding transcriptional repressor) of toxin-antitoxin stability system
MDMMTINDYLMVMRSVRVAELKSRLSEHLRLVRRGQSLTVLDRETPIARVVPVEAPAGGLTIRPPIPGTGSPGGVSLPPALSLGTDAVGLLLREREVER